VWFGSSPSCEKKQSQKIKTICLLNAIECNLRFHHVVYLEYPEKLCWSKWNNRRLRIAWSWLTVTTGYGKFIASLSSVACLPWTRHRQCKLLCNMLLDMPPDLWIPTWYSAERSVTLHSFDFTKYRLWTSLFRRGTIVNGQIVVCSFDLTEYHLWKIYFWMFFDATQRAQPTLRLHSSRFVVESCDVFVGNRTLFEQFGNISTSCLQRFENRMKAFDPQLIAFRNFVKTGIQFAV